MESHTFIIGHRGASYDAPENTLASFRLAFEQGADGIEADFRLTRDGHIVCLHDPSTCRTSGLELKVEGASLFDLQQLEVGGWKGGQYAGERIPTLRQVLSLLPPGKLLFIELKCGPEIIAALESDLAGSGVGAERIRFLSFDAGLIRMLKERLPGYRACWLTDYRLDRAWHPSQTEVLETLGRCRADGLASRDREILDLSLVQELRRREMEIHVWTVDSPRAARRLCGLGVDSVMTNRPGWLRDALAEDGREQCGRGP